MSMLSRERVKKAVHFQRPDYPPLLHGFAGGLIVEQPQWVSRFYTEFPEDFGIDDDIVVPYRNPACYRKGNKFTTEWGAKKEVATEGVQAITTWHPLADWDNFATYKPLQIKNDTYVELEKQIAESAHSKYIVCAIPALFETLQDMRGFENLMIDIAVDDGKAKSMADMVFNVMMQAAEGLCKLDCDCIYFADDWGTQQALMISPQMWRNFFKPYYRQLGEFVRSQRKDLWMHSCGWILDIIPDLIEVGVNILHPQVELMMGEKFFNAIKGKLCIVSDIDRQRVLPFGSANLVYEHTINVFRQLYDPNGGLILRAEIGTDMPKANVEAFYNACKHFQHSVKLTETGGR